MTEAHEADTDVARELRALGSQIAALQAEVRRLSGGSLPFEESSGWDDDIASAPSYTWLSGLQSPRALLPRVPRLPLELAFLAGAAVLAGVADLRPLAIAGVMAAAWVIVAFAELAGSRGDRLRRQLLLAAPVVSVEPVDPSRPDPAWLTPPVERTLIGSNEDRPTMVSTLPPRVDDPEATAERRPAG